MSGAPATEVLAVLVWECYDIIVALLNVAEQV